MIGSDDEEERGSHQRHRHGQREGLSVMKNTGERSTPRHRITAQPSSSGIRQVEKDIIGQALGRHGDAHLKDRGLDVER